jgi:hypothetical protein
VKTSDELERLASARPEMASRSADVLDDRERADLLAAIVGSTPGRRSASMRRVVRHRRTWIVVIGVTVALILGGVYGSRSSDHGVVPRGHSRSLTTETSGIGAITLGADGLGPVDFGSRKEQATAELTQLLGPASGGGINTGCGAAFTELDWGELAVEFHHNVFSGYRDQNRPNGSLQLGPVNTAEPLQPAAKTAAGIGLEDSLGQLRAAYPKLSLVGANRLQASNGLSFVNNSRYSPGSPQSKIIEIRVGTCGDY